MDSFFIWYRGFGWALLWVQMNAKHYNNGKQYVHPAIRTHVYSLQGEKYESLRDLFCC